PHRDHVRALPPEPWLREGPRPFRAGDRARGEGTAPELRRRVSAPVQEGMERRKGKNRIRSQRGESRSAQPRSRHLPDGGLLGEGGQEQGRHLAWKAGREGERVDEATTSWRKPHIRRRRS